MQILNAIFEKNEGKSDGDKHSIVNHQRKHQ